MTQAQMNTILVMLDAAYPNLFPKKDIEVAVLVWYSDLGHLPYKTVERAAADMRKRCKWPSIAEMWVSIISVSSPYRAEIKMEIQHQIGSGNGSTRTLHQISKRIWDSLGGYATISRMEAGLFETVFNREYPDAAKWWFDLATKPENAAMIGEKGRVLLEA